MTAPASSRGNCREPSDADRNHVVVQVTTIYRRARLLRLTIALAGTSVLLASVLIIALFVSALMKRDYGLALRLIFLPCMASFMAARFLFFLPFPPPLGASIEL